MKEANQVVQVAKQMSSAGHANAEDSPTTQAMVNAMETLNKAVGVAQHHDAITGTEKQAVTYDYDQRMHDGIHGFVDAGLGQDYNFYHCPLLNVSQCATSEAGEEFTVNVYNPLGRTRSDYIRIPVTQGGWNVTDLETGEVSC